MAANSTLQIEVVSVGIADTVRKLDLLGNAAARNEGKVKLLTDSLGVMMAAQERAASSSAQHATLMSAIAQQMGLASQAAKEISKSVNKLTADLDLMTGSANNSTNAFQRKSSAGNIVNSTLRAMTTAALAYLGINFAKGIVEAADGWGMMQAKLKLATGSMESAKQIQGELFDMAQRIRVPLDDAAKLYTRMAVPMQRMGKDAKQTAEQVEYVSLALKLNGATAGEASSVMLQYSQSVNAGRLNGAEFNAVAEGAPGILRAIEAELKATAGWSEYGGKSLKKMGADGEITFDLMNRAAQRALPEMRKQFNELPLTVDGAMQRVKNAWFKAMGELGEETGLGTKLAQAISILETSIPKIRDVLVGVFLFIYENFSKIALVVEAIIAMKFVLWLGSVSTAMFVAAGAATATASGIAVAETAILAFGRGMAMLAGPVGIFIALVGVGLVQAYRAFTSEAPAAEKIVTESTAKGTQTRIDMIQKEIDKIDERNGKSKILPAPTDSSGLTSIAKQEAEIARHSARKLAAKTDFEKSMIQIDIDFATKQGAILAAQEAKMTQYRIAEDAKIRTSKVREWESKFNLKTESKTEEVTRRVAEAKKEAEDLGIIWNKAHEDRVRLDVLGKNMGAAATPKVDHYAKLKADIQATTDALKEYADTNEKATASEKLKYRLDRGGDAEYNKLSPKARAELSGMIASNIAMEQQALMRDKLNKATVDAAQEDDKYYKTVANNVSTIDKEILKTREQIAAINDSKTAAKDLAAVKLEADAMDIQRLAIQQMEKNGKTDNYERLMEEARKTRELADAKRELGAAQDTSAAEKEMDKLLDPKKALDFGDALSSAFGKGGEALGKMTKALGIYAKAQEDIADTRESFMKSPDSAKRQSALAALDKKEVQSKLRAYGDMAGAAKGYFAENSTRHKIMSTLEKGLRIAETTETVANYAIKSGLLTAFLGLFVTSKAAEAAVQGAATANSVGAAGVEGSAWGVVAVVKALASLPPPMNFIAGAAVLAAVVGLGVIMSGSVGSGGGGFDLKAHQDKQGTGTVLGDSSAKSESITKAMSSLEDNSNIGLTLTVNMLSSLRGIEASMQGLAAAIFKVSGMTTGKNFGITEGRQGGGIIDSIFGGATSTKIDDTGLALNGTASDFRGGKGARQYVDVTTTESGGWFSGDSSSSNRDYMTASSDITTTLGRVFQSINDTIEGAATSLGANGVNIKAAMDAYIINTEVSFKDLKGDELSQALNNVFSASADNIARSVFPSLEAFQKAGEGYYQTLMRVSTGTEQAQNALNSFGIQMIGRDSLVNKTGDIAAELVRQSIMTANAGTTMSDIMRVMDGSLSDLVEGYKSLLDIQDNMRGAKIGSNVSMATIRGAGGVPELQSAMQDFVDNFYTDAEKQRISFSKIRAEFGRLNVVMPATKDGFKDLVASLMAGNAASQEMAGRVLLLGGAFSDALTTAESARTEAIAKAKSDLKDAYDKESSALQSVIDKMKGFTESLTTFKSTLITGDMSTKSTSEKYATSKVAYDDVSTRALSGDVTAIASFEKSASEMLKFSRDVNASGAGYTADYDRVLSQTEALRQYTSSQVDVATASLDALKLQVKGLLDINTSVLTVTAAIVALQLAMVAVNPLMAIDGSHANGLSNVPFDGYIAELHKDERVLTASENREYNTGGNTIKMSDSGLVEEVKALRNELRMLREEQREQTANVIGAHYDATERNAQMVVDGNKSAMEDASYFDRTKNGLV